MPECKSIAKNLAPWLLGLLLWGLVFFALLGAAHDRADVYFHTFIAPYDVSSDFERGAAGGDTLRVSFALRPAVLGPDFERDSAGFLGWQGREPAPGKIRAVAIAAEGQPAAGGAQVLVNGRAAQFCDEQDGLLWFCLDEPREDILRSLILEGFEPSQPSAVYL
ncbi:MAG: hypothetical protein D6B26_03040, partial [Spirochaetaceae bacterium]